jgi:hypothetical protein
MFSTYIHSLVDVATWLRVLALAHLTEFPDCYTRLAKMEAEAKSFWDSKKHQQPRSP